MNTIVFPKEKMRGEKRCALLPNNVKQYKLLGADVLVESGLGEHLFISDDEYSKAGAMIVDSRETLLARADIVLSVHKLPLDEVITHCKPSVKLLSFLDPFNNPDYIGKLCQHNITSMSVEMIPRISRCQKMDALSSQASLAGYVMVVKAMNAFASTFPMMMTPAGTLKPANVFVIGAGVAGLQAIATAKRLGASVTAFDTRDVVAEQVKSLGAKFLEIDLGNTGQTSQGYAQALTPEQMKIQQKAQAKCIAESDIVITTAQLFGRKPPMLIDDSTIASMKPGSVIVDMAAENGGNVEGSEPNKTVMKHQVTIIGTGNWANEVSKAASQMYANNLYNFISEFWDKDTQSINFDVTDEILSSCVITHDGKIINQMIRDLFSKEVA